MNDITLNPPSKNDLLDELEVAMAKMPQVECKVVDRFTKGMYIRECQIPAGTMLTSMVHKTQHPFILLQGTIKVTSDNEGSIIYEAPYTGITEPNTRRALHALTDEVLVVLAIVSDRPTKGSPDHELRLIKLLALADTLLCLQIKWLKRGCYRQTYNHRVGCYG